MDKRGGADNEAETSVEKSMGEDKKMKERMNKERDIEMHFITITIMATEVYCAPKTLFTVPLFH